MKKKATNESMDVFFSSDFPPKEMSGTVAGAGGGGAGEDGAAAAGSESAAFWAAAGAGGSSGGAAAPVAGWIDPDLLEIKFQDCVCALCFGVMVQPTSGCPDGHSFCKGCHGKALDRKKQCPVCRHPVTDAQKLVRMRPLEGIISVHAKDRTLGPSGPLYNTLASAAKSLKWAQRREAEFVADEIERAHAPV